MRHWSTTTALFAAATLIACIGATFPPAANAGSIAASAITQPDARLFLFSWGMFADPVFDRDVETFSAAFTESYGEPAQADLFGYTSPRLAMPDPMVMQREMVEMAASAVNGRDTVVVMLTSHGAPDTLTIKTKPNGPVIMMPAEQVATFLAPLAQDRQILILQACYSGSLIDDLRSPNRIILTAASSERASFGCEPESDNTWFIKSINTAMEVGGSWEQVFARTRELVMRDEAAEGVLPSNPQSFVGANMHAVWTRGAL